VYWRWLSSLPFTKNCCLWSNEFFVSQRRKYRFKRSLNLIWQMKKRLSCFKLWLTKVSVLSFRKSLKQCIVGKNIGRVKKECNKAAL
jgi:hypothetical protein